MPVSERKDDPFLALSDEIERIIDAAQADHLNGNLSHARSKLEYAIRLIGKLELLEAQSAG